MDNRFSNKIFTPSSKFLSLTLHHGTRLENCTTMHLKSATSKLATKSVIVKPRGRLLPIKPLPIDLVVVYRSSCIFTPAIYTGTLASTYFSADSCVQHDSQPLPDHLIS